MNMGLWAIRVRMWDQNLILNLFSIKQRIQCIYCRSASAVVLEEYSDHGYDVTIPRYRKPQRK